MPVTESFEATRGIRQDKKLRDAHTAIVALTADALVVDRERCMDAGVDDVLTKPVGSAEVSATLKRWTGRHPEAITRW